MNWDELLRLAESDLVKALTNKVIEGFISKIAIGKLAFLVALSPFVGWGVGLLIALFVKWGDWGLYMIGDSLKNTAEGNAYEKAGLDLKNLPPTATPEEIDRAKKAKQDAFDALWGVS